MSTTTPLETVIVVDDEHCVLLAYASALKPRRVLTTSNALEAMSMAERETPDLALIDLRLENQPPASVFGVEGRRGRYPACGIDIVVALRNQHPAMRIVVITGGRTWAYSKEARAAGANGLLSKRLGPSEIISIIEGGRIDDYDAPPQHPMSLDRATYEYLTRVFVAEERNIQRTAEVLGITRNKLKRKLREDSPDR